MLGALLAPSLEPAADAPAFAPPAPPMPPPPVVLADPPARGAAPGVSDPNLDSAPSVHDAPTSDDVRLPIARRPNVVLSIRDLMVIGDLEVRTIREVADEHLGELTACYAFELRASPRSSGVIEVKSVVNGGRVTQAEVTSNTTGSEALADCLVRKIKRWTHPEGGLYIVRYPFIFERKG